MFSGGSALKAERECTSITEFWQAVIIFDLRLFGEEASFGRGVILLFLFVALCCRNRIVARPLLLLWLCGVR